MAIRKIVSKSVFKRLPLSAKRAISKVARKLSKRKTYRRKRY